MKHARFEPIDTDRLCAKARLLEPKRDDDETVPAQSASIHLFPQARQVKRNGRVPSAAERVLAALRVDSLRDVVGR